MTPGHPGSLSAIFQCLSHRPAKHVSVLDGCEPEGELVSEVVAGAARAVTLYEGRGAEVLQTRARARQGLAPALRTRRRVLQDIVYDI